jgi:hypothetical protein
MKFQRVLGALFSILFFISFISCSKDDADLENQENEIEYKVYSNTKGVPMTLENGLIIKDYWSEKFVTKGWTAQIVVTCKDPTVLITAEIYVNGVLKAKGEKNSFLSIGYQIKGEGY